MELIWRGALMAVVMLLIGGVTFGSTKERFILYI